MDKVKIVFFVPESSADRVREVVGNAGGGVMGNYSHCTFTIVGTGRWLPQDGASPTIGEVGKMSKEEEKRVEFICERKIAKKVVNAIRKVHPYEEPAIDIYPLIAEEEL